jgi:hypothetical protein
MTAWDEDLRCHHYKETGVVTSKASDASSGKRIVRIMMSGGNQWRL